MPVGIFISLFIVGVTGATAYNHYLVHDSFNINYFVVMFFLVLNLLICFWELCLLARPKQVKADYDRNMSLYRDDKQQAVMNYMQARVTPRNLLSASFWSQTWSSYALFDGSYADKRTYGYTIDIGNGLSTLVPGILLHFGLTYHFLSAQVLGIIALLFFYQVTYGTVLYWISFIINKRYQQITFKENMIYIVGTNAPWFILGLFGIYTAIRLVIDNNYSVFGI